MLGLKLNHVSKRGHWNNPRCALCVLTFRSCDKNYAENIHFYSNFTSTSSHRCNCLWVSLSNGWAPNKANKWSHNLNHCWPRWHMPSLSHSEVWWQIVIYVEKLHGNTCNIKCISLQCSHQAFVQIVIWPVQFNIWRVCGATKTLMEKRKQC